MFWLYQCSKGLSSIKYISSSSGTLKNATRLYNLVNTLVSLFWEVAPYCTYDRTARWSSEFLVYIVHFQSSGALLSCSVTAMGWIWCIKHFNKEMSCYWLVAVTPYLSKSGTVSALRNGGIAVQSALSQTCVLWPRVNERLRLLKYTMFFVGIWETVLEFITKADPCGRIYWDCLTQSKPGFSRID